MSKLLLFLATLGPTGYMPFAPGTFGTLAGLLFVWLFPCSDINHIKVIIAGAIIGTIAASSAEKQLKQKDSSRIVADEFIGYYVSTAFVPHTYSLLIAAFLLFRFFDITKPLMIKKLEKSLKGGLGVMSDDILAGLYTNIVIQAWIRLSGAVQ